MSAMVYKCRLCGEEFKGVQGNDLTLRHNLGILTGQETAHNKGTFSVVRHEVHCCKDDSLGFGDILGVRGKEPSP